MKFWRKPLDVEKFKVPRGMVKIIVERCKGCAFCVEYCPTHILQISKRFNKKGYHYPEVKNGAVCVDCNLCEAICPEFAIYSEPVEEGAGGEEEKAGTETDVEEQARRSTGRGAAPPAGGR